MHDNSQRETKSIKSDSILTSKNFSVSLSFPRHRMHFCKCLNFITQHESHLLDENVHVINANSRMWNENRVFIYILWGWSTSQLGADEIAQRLFLFSFSIPIHVWLKQTRNAFDLTFATHAWPLVNRNQIRMAMDTGIKGTWEAFNERNVRIEWNKFSSRIYVATGMLFVTPMFCCLLDN